MYVCICNAITDSEIREARERGIDTLPALSAATGVASCCGMCAEQAHEILTGDNCCDRDGCCRAA